MIYCYLSPWSFGSLGGKRSPSQQGVPVHVWSLGNNWAISSIICIGIALGSVSARLGSAVLRTKKCRAGMSQAQKMQRSRCRGLRCSQPPGFLQIGFGNTQTCGSTFWCQSTPTDGWKQLPVSRCFWNNLINKLSLVVDFCFSTQSQMPYIK